MASASKAALLISDWSNVIQTAAIIITGIAAIVALHINSKLSRHRATISMLLAQRTDELLREAKKEMSKLHADTKISITSLACKGTEDDPRRQHVLVVLNNYEFIAVGVREKALDENVYKRAHYSNLMKDWNAVKPFVTELRTQTGRPTLFQEFEHLHDKWKKNPLKVDKS